MGLYSEKIVNEIIVLTTYYLHTFEQNFTLSMKYKIQTFNLVELQSMTN